MMTEMGFSGALTTPTSVSGTWILHFTSSIGVRRKEVKAPEKAPVNQSAERGRLWSREERPAA